MHVCRKSTGTWNPVFTLGTSVSARVSKAEKRCAPRNATTRKCTQAQDRSMGCDVGGCFGQQVSKAFHFSADAGHMAAPHHRSSNSTQAFIHTAQTENAVLFLCFFLFSM